MSNLSKAYLLGGGIGSLAAAAFMIRDGAFSGENITILEAKPILGGSLDGAGNPTDGYSLRGGRMLTTDNYECTWDLFKSIPSLTLPGKTVFDETIEFNEKHKSNSMARLVDSRRAKVPVISMGFSMPNRKELLELSLAGEAELGNSCITDWLSPEFFETEFWYMWATTFAFQPWHSAIEFKRYLHRFMLEFTRIETLGGVKRTVYNQYDSFVRPLQSWLAEQNVRFYVDCQVTDLERHIAADKLVVTGIHYQQGGESKTIAVESELLLPSLPLADWQGTYTTLHLWTQIVGKIRLALSPAVNHWWHSTLYVTPRGLTTGTIPYKTRAVEIRFDFIDRQLHIASSDGATQTVALMPRSVSDFYQAVMAALKAIDIEVRIWTMPQEIADPIPFDRDDEHATYDPESAQRFWQILIQTDRILRTFRSNFIGKSSPVHFFWGSFDLALTRFSGRAAPQHPGGVPGMADWVTREAYSHEVSSCGFWAGDKAVTEAVFYAYAYPEPEAFQTYPIQPKEAFYNAQMREFVLPYEVVRKAVDPEAMLLTFLQSTYEAAANLAHWDRGSLERDRLELNPLSTNAVPT